MASQLNFELFGIFKHSKSTLGMHVCLAWRGMPTLVQCHIERGQGSWFDRTGREGVREMEGKMHLKN